jgi:hypothetical protein
MMQYDGQKSIVLSFHAKEQCEERGTNESEVVKAITDGEWKVAKKHRLECKITLPCNEAWNGHFYINKEIRPIFVDEPDKIVVITVYVYYN